MDTRRQFSWVCLEILNAGFLSHVMQHETERQFKVFMKQLLQDIHIDSIVAFLKEIIFLTKI